MGGWLSTENRTQDDPRLKVQELFTAVKQDEIDVVQKILDDGVVLINWTGDEKETALHYVRSKEMAQLLVDKGATAGFPNEFCETPLHLAAGNDRADLCRVLLEHGADVNAKTENGRTPLMWAASAGAVSTTKLLIEEGADVNAVNTNKATALHTATQRGWMPICKLLLESSANANAADRSGNTPLHDAAKNGRFEVAQLLIQFGGKTHIQNNAGEIPVKVLKRQNRGNGYLMEFKAFLEEVFEKRHDRVKPAFNPAKS